jgi:hypothetical protein
MSEATPTDQPNTQRPGELNPTAQAPKAWVAPAVIALLIVGSLPVRLYNLHSPLLEIHHFRQTYNAFTVWCYLHQGIDLMRPMVPVLGPPWVLPIEFPIFQASATILIRLTGMDIDAGCRLTNIIYFYASAGMLYLLARKLFPRRSVALCVLLFYLWTPFSIVWSRTCMIEFVAVLFALGYVYFLTLWLDSRKNVVYALLALTIGCLAALAKIITIVPLVPLLICLPAAAIWGDIRRLHPSLKPTHVKALARAVGGQWVTVSVTLALYLIPLGVGRTWVAYTDSVKEASPQIRWQTSTNEFTWHYGTIEQRLTPGWWRLIVYRIAAYVTPYALLGLPVLALIVAQRAPPFTRMVLYSAVLGTILPVVIFFNLYHEHDYYLCAVLSMIALVTGYGLDYVVRTWVLADWRTAIPIITAAAMSCFIAYDYMNPSYTVGYDNEICELGRAIDEVTGPNDCVVVADWSWAPSILYYAKRRGYMVQEDAAAELRPDVRSVPFLREPEFTTLVCQQNHPWFNMWRGLTLLKRVGPFAIIRISH